MHLNDPLQHQTKTATTDQSVFGIEEALCKPEYTQLYIQSQLRLPISKNEYFKQFKYVTTRHDIMKELTILNPLNPSGKHLYHLIIHRVPCTVPLAQNSDYLHYEH